MVRKNIFYVKNVNILNIIIIDQVPILRLLSFDIIKQMHLL